MTFQTDNFTEQLFPFISQRMHDILVIHRLKTATKMVLKQKLTKQCAK